MTHATGPLLDDASPLPPAAPASPGAAPPRVPSGLRVEEHILPSGRVVRLKRVLTSEYLAAKERAAVRVGKAPDPHGKRLTAAMDREMLALMVVGYTAADAVDWAALMEEQAAEQQAEWAKQFDAKTAPEDRPPFVYLPDREKLVQRCPPEAWVYTTPQELVAGPGRTINDVFNEVADYELLVQAAAGAMLPTRDLSLIVGKARVVG